MVNVKQFYSSAKSSVKNAQNKHALHIIKRDVARTHEEIKNSNLSRKEKSTATREYLKVNKQIRTKLKNM